MQKTKKFVSPLLQQRLSRLLFFMDVDLRERNYLQAWEDFCSLYDACPENVQEHCRDEKWEVEKQIAMLKCGVRADVISTAVAQQNHIALFIAKKIRSLYAKISRAMYEENVFAITNFGPTPRPSSLEDIALKLNGV